MPSTPPTFASRIVELRRYTLRPRQRDVLVELFETELVEPQEREGMRVIGQFRDLDDPDRFVWLRGFADMADRARGLESFYGGPVWHVHGPAANATMVDSDDVLLLRPLDDHTSFAPGERPRDVIPFGRGFVSATIVPLDAGAGETARRWLEMEVLPEVLRTGSSILGCCVTEPSENTFPRLPVREGENVLVWFAGHPSVAALDAATAPDAPAQVGARCTPGLREAPQRLRLQPTALSALHGQSAPCARFA